MGLSKKKWISQEERARRRAEWRERPAMTYPKKGTVLTEWDEKNGPWPPFDCDCCETITDETYELDVLYAAKVTWDSK
jgi:hypothetical protein